MNRVMLDLEALVEEWGEEAATKRRRARSWEGHLSEQHRMKGETAGLSIAMHELRQVLNGGNDAE